MKDESNAQCIMMIYALGIMSIVFGIIDLYLNKSPFLSGSLILLGLFGIMNAVRYHYGYRKTITIDYPRGDRN